MVGLIGKKVGMTQVFDESGILTPVTVIKIEDNYVVGERTTERDGYQACVLGSADMKPSRVNKPRAGQFKGGTKPQKHIIEFREFGTKYKVGQKFGVDIFDGISYVDVTGISLGKGYQGVMKRHNFGGGRKTHGSKFHREAGSTGMAATPSKVFKGTKMAGRMGGVRSTVQNLRVVGLDAERQSLLVRGAVPGRRNGMVIVKKARKK